MALGQQKLLCLPDNSQRLLEITKQKWLLARNRWGRKKGNQVLMQQWTAEHGRSVAGIDIYEQIMSCVYKILSHQPDNVVITRPEPRPKANLTGTLAALALREDILVDFMDRAVGCFNLFQDTFEGIEQSNGLMTVPAASVDSLRRDFGELISAVEDARCALPSSDSQLQVRNQIWEHSLRSRAEVDAIIATSVGTSDAKCLCYHGV
jgi:hypothetical protein